MLKPAGFIIVIAMITGEYGRRVFLK